MVDIKTAERSCELKFIDITKIKQKNRPLLLTCGMRRVRFRRSRQHVFEYNGAVYFKSDILVFNKYFNQWIPEVFNVETGKDVTDEHYWPNLLVMPLYLPNEIKVYDKTSKEVKCLTSPKSVCRNLHFTLV